MEPDIDLFSGGDGKDTESVLTSDLNTNKFPVNTVPLDNQVAGHSFEDGNYMIGMLKHKDGYVLKPVNRPEQGKREIAFYESFQTTFDTTLLQFKEFIPEFKGTTSLTVNGKTVMFLKLSDITAGFVHPCIMDIKIGAQTWEPGVPLKKREAEEKKYTFCKQSLGFCIPGFQVFRVTTGTLAKFSKDYGKQLTKHTVPDALKLFLNIESKGSLHVLNTILQRLYKIRDWWRAQRLLHIYSSSILISYDAQYLLDSIATDNYSSRTNEHCTSVHVALIDFAHCIPANGEIDSNYISGIENLVKEFEKILAEL